MKKFLALSLFIIIIAFAACSSPTPVASQKVVKATVLVPVTVPVTRIVEATRVVEVTRLVEVTRVVKATVLVPVTVTPLPKPTATPTPKTAQRVKLVAPVALTRGGVTVMVVDGGCVDINNPSFAKLRTQDTWKNAKTACILSIDVKNTTKGTINVFPDQGTVQIGDEQIELANFLFDEEGDIGGECLAGAKKHGLIMFAVTRTTYDKVKKMRLVFSGPADANFNRLGKGYDFTLAMVAK